MYRSYRVYILLSLIRRAKSSQVTASVAQDTRHERHEVEEASERPPHGVQSLSEHTTDPGAETIGLKVATPMSESLDSVLAPVRSVGGSGSDQSPKDLSPLRDIWKDSDSGAHVVRQASSRGWWQRERGLLQDSHHTIFEENGEDEVGYELPDEKRGRVGPARILKSINDVSWANKEGTEGPQVPMTSAALQSKELSPLRHMPPIIEEFEPLHPAQQSLKKKKKKAYLPYPPEGSHVGVHLGGSTGNSELAHAADQPAKKKKKKKKIEPNSFIDPTSSASLSASQAFLASRTPQGNLSAAATAAAVRSAETFGPSTPSRVGDTQTKRMLRKRSSSTSSSNATKGRSTPLKYARAEDLPSFPSRGVALNSASGAANLANNSYKDFEH